MFSKDKRLALNINAAVLAPFRSNELKLLAYSKGMRRALLLPSVLYHAVSGTGSPASREEIPDLESCFLAAHAHNPHLKYSFERASRIIIDISPSEGNEGVRADLTFKRRNRTIAEYWFVYTNDGRSFHWNFQMF